MNDRMNEVTLQIIEHSPIKSDILYHRDKLPLTVTMANR